MKARDLDTQACVVVKLFAWLRDSFGWTERRIPVERAPDVRRLLQHLSEDAPSEGQLLMKTGGVADGFIVLLNGLNIDFAGGLGTGLRAEDEVAIFPPISGG